MLLHQQAPALAALMPDAFNALVCMQVLHGGAHAMTARQLEPNAKGFTVVATQRSGAGSVPEALHRLSLLADQPLAPLTELPCVRIERFEGGHPEVDALLVAVSGGAVSSYLWVSTQPSASQGLTP